RMSQIHGKARPPAASIARQAECTVPGSLGWGRSVLPTTAIRAPSRAARSAMASPMPRLAPVMNNTLFARVVIVPLVYLADAQLARRRERHPGHRAADPFLPPFHSRRRDRRGAGDGGADR